MRRVYPPACRGNQVAPGRLPVFPRSIPARAGEPGVPCGTPSICTVYPRACGGTAGMAASAALAAGLSPRVRGNPIPRPGGHSATRSIPARAGEPGTLRCDVGQSRVYPRACGGTAGAHRSLVAGVGLSPRVRGNRLGHRALYLARGSIPARAGEPDRKPADGTDDRVYPRACGGTLVLRVNPSTV